MARGDPAEKAALLLEARRFANRCDMQIALIQRADALRELTRLSGIALPYALAEDFGSRDAQRRVAIMAEDRAKEIIEWQIEQYQRAEQDRKEILERKMLEEWSNLTGPLSHLRHLAQSKLLASQQRA